MCYLVQSFFSILFDTCFYEKKNGNVRIRFSDFIFIIALLANYLFYFTGVVGDWKNWFTVSDNEKFDKFLIEKMSNSKWTFKYQ